MVRRACFRRLTLTAHIVCSVGWLGAVGVFLALSIVGMASNEEQVVRSVHVAMDAGGWSVLVPFSFASMATGLLQSMTTFWGVLRHYWVLAKLFINAAAIVVLLLYMTALRELAESANSDASVDELRTPSPIVHAGSAVLLLVAATALSVYKPRGLTRYGQRALRRTGQDAVAGPTR